MEMVDGSTGEVTTVPVVLPPPPFGDGSKVHQETTLALACARVYAGLTDPARALETLPPDIHQIEVTVKMLYAWWKLCEAAVLARMVERNATQIGDPKKGPALLRKPDHNYDYNEDGLKGLLEFVGKPDGLTAEEYETAMRYKFDPSKTALNLLVKRGGKVAEIVNLNVRDNPKDKLELKGGGHK